jgi:hypothetical protein
MAKKQTSAKRRRGAKKVTTSARKKSNVVRKKAATKKATRKKVASKKPTRRAAPAPANKRLAARKPSRSVSKSVLTTAPAAVERPATAPTEPEPQAFWDPKGGRSAFTGDSKAHTKPADQRSHIRMTAPRTWSNRQPGRG